MSFRHCPILRTDRYLSHHEAKEVASGHVLLSITQLLGAEARTGGQVRRALTTQNKMVHCLPEPKQFIQRP